MRADNGDNEAYRAALREREVENVVVDMNDAPSTHHEAIALIPEGGKVFHNTDQDVDIRVGKKTIRHSLLHPSDDAIKAIGSINMIVANAVKIGELPVATNETGHTRSVSVYYTPVDIEGRHFSARLVIKKLENNSKVLDELLLYNMAMHKKKNTIDLNVNASQSEVGVNPDNVSGYKVKDLIHSTQEADKKLLGITTETGGGVLFRAALKAKNLWRQLINGVKRLLGMEVVEGS